MRYIFLILFLPILSFSQPLVDLQNFASGFIRPVDIQNAGDDRLFIVEQRGMIWIVDSLGQTYPRPFLDIRDRVNDAANEQGLLGLAFNPDYANNPNFVVHYTAGGDSTVISLFSVSSDPDSADPNSEFLILRSSQPFDNHNGGSIVFGPEGYLYIALGDGGSGGDPGDRAQDLTTILGKILRININTALPYGIPPDNPFAGAGGGIREEIWAYGLRNPWKMSFDRLTNDLWIGDVGQSDWEEIDFQLSTSDGGENYGWRCREGAHVYNPTGCPPDSTMVDPVYEYSQSGNGCSVTGGVVYRGSRFPGLYGHYFFSDVCGEWIRSLDPSFNMTDHGDFSGNYFVAFGEDHAGEVYVASLYNGLIYQLVEPVNSLSSGYESNSFRIYPNPAKDRISLSGENLSEIDEMRIINCLGKTVLARKMHQDSGLEIDISGITSGIYQLGLYSDRGLVSSKRLVLE